MHTHPPHLFIIFWCIGLCFLNYPQAIFSNLMSHRLGWFAESSGINACWGASVFLGKNSASAHQCGAPVLKPSG